jgi:hypothetical protein
MNFQQILHLRIFMKTYMPNQYLVITETTDTLCEDLHVFLYSFPANVLNIYWTGNTLGVSCKEE